MPLGGEIPTKAQYDYAYVGRYAALLKTQDYMMVIFYRD